MDVVMLLYPGMTALDLVGPHEVLSRIPGSRTRRVAEVPGPIETDSGLFLTADEALAAVTRADILFVPGAGDAWPVNLPREGTVCRFSYGGNTYRGLVKVRKLEIEGIDGAFSSFSGASVAVTQTSRNGWNDWELQSKDGWVLADLWRSQT